MEKQMVASFPLPVLRNESGAVFRELSERLDCTNFDADQKALLKAITSASPFLRDCLVKELAWYATVSDVTAALEGLRAEVQKFGVTASSSEDLLRELRIAKRRTALLLGIADLGKQLHGEQVTNALSDFASASLSAAFDHVLLQQARSGKIELADPDEPQRESGLVVLGMGKFGAGELNYSSDIDIVVFHEDAPGMKLLTDDPVTLLNRMMKQVVKIMQERTADGYVFRTDLRLRPDPSSTPMIIPVEAALNYYEGQGQNWERAAMIKAAPVAGDREAGANFLRELTPFIWRKYLDFAAIQDVHSIKRQIHVHKGHGKIKVKGHNIKLGRGGIREIEFFAQTQQLIAGGRNPALRTRETIASLDALAKNHWIEDSTRDELSIAYWFLRNLEHRIQMINDEQIHTLPEGKADFEQLAALCGFSKVAEFSKVIETALKCVESHYASLFEEAPQLSSGGNLVFTGDDEDPGTVETLQKLGFRAPAEAIKIIKQWHVARVPALRTSAARELLTELMPSLLQAFSGASEPDAALYTFDRFISGLPAGIQLFAILKSNPELNALLVRILTGAPALAEQIASKPHVFDGMLENGAEVMAHSVEDWRAILSGILASVSSYELKLDAARRFRKEMQFFIGSRMLSGRFDCHLAACALSNLAEAIICEMLELVQNEFAEAHGRVPDAKTSILAMGRLGSRELTIGSDLDLIFLYDFDPDIDQSDGDRPLDPTLYYMRLIKRFITAMTAPTAEGVLYELDFRLRPSGKAGPLATHVDGFLKYQREEAWIWEAQALTRARAVAGDADLGSKLEKAIPNILMSKSNHADLSSEIYGMRMRVDQEKGTGELWDAKTGRGSLLDIEFIAQWLAIKFSDGSPTPIGTRSVLETIGSKNLAESLVEHLVSSFDSFSRILHLQRVCLGGLKSEEEWPKGFAEIICSALELPDLGTCRGYVSDMKARTSEIFEQLLGEGNIHPDKVDGGTIKGVNP